MSSLWAVGAHEVNNERWFGEAQREGPPIYRAQWHSPLTSQTADPTSVTQVPTLFFTPCCLSPDRESEGEERIWRWPPWDWRPALADEARPGILSQNSFHFSCAGHSPSLLPWDSSFLRQPSRLWEQLLVLRRRIPGPPAVSSFIGPPGEHLLTALGSAAPQKGGREPQLASAPGSQVLRLRVRQGQAFAGSGFCHLWSTYRPGPGWWKAAPVP